MRPKMIVKFGITVVIAVAVISVYIQHTEPDKQLGHQLGDEDADEADDRDDVNTQNNRNTQSNKNMLSNDKEEPRQFLNGIENNPVSKKTNNKELNSEIVEPKSQDKKKNNGVLPVYFSTALPAANALHLSLVACGDRKDESLVLLKSAILFTKKHLVIHIFTETELQKSFRDQLEIWPERFLSRLDYFIYNISFPTGDNSDQWKSLFKPCASQRLFLPVLLTKVDSVIYVDTDVLFLRPLEDLWSFLNRFNSTQVAALSPDNEDSGASWYNRFARHPYYGKLGLNSGVVLMNLTRMRESVWLISLLKYYEEYKMKLVYGDQDLINIYFHYYPEQLYVCGCDWNYRVNHCMYMSVCQAAETEGVSILHGSGRAMYNNKQPALRAVYDAFKDHRLGDDIQYRLLVQIERNLKDTENTRCGKVGFIFTKQIEMYSHRMREAEEKARNQNENNNRFSP